MVPEKQKLIKSIQNTKKTYAIAEIAWNGILYESIIQ